MVTREVRERGYVMRLTAVGLAVPLLALGLAGVDAQENVTVNHALSLIGSPKYGPDFEQLDYANPGAPKGGFFRQHAIGSFDTLNPFILKGAPAGALGLTFEALMASTTDDMSTEYALLAESVEVPDDLTWVAFNLRPEARWHDGTPVTVDDVIFSFETLKAKGQPFYRFYYANVVGIEKTGPRKVTFRFTGPPNRELPQIMGQLPILSKAHWATRDFEKATLEPMLGSGPYRVAAVEAGRSITYERVPDYWGQNLPVNRGRYNFDRIRIDYYRDETVALEAFKAHKYDFRLETTSKVWATLYDFPARANGDVIKVEVPHARPTGMQSFVFNTRRDKFHDRKVRQALAYAFDFEWSNKTLFFGQYARTNSYFSNSELAARGLPTAAELALLNPFRGQVPDEVFNEMYQPPITDGSGNIRRNLRTASKLLAEAGWVIRDGKLVWPETGAPLEIEFLLVQPAFERVVSPIIKNLERLGVAAGIRTIDSSQYINRIREYDFDIVVSSWGQSESPGNEQRDFWSSKAADRPGSRNLAGINDPVVDALIYKIIAAPDRASLVTATRALDRVLLWGHYVIPNWHSRVERIAYWNKFGKTDRTPKYGVDLFAWWIDPAMEAALGE
jgi:microcin C transport system substrate-binding protein